MGRGDEQTLLRRKDGQYVYRKVFITYCQGNEIPSHSSEDGTYQKDPRQLELAGMWEKEIFIHSWKYDLLRLYGKQCEISQKAKNRATI